MRDRATGSDQGPPQIRVLIGEEGVLGVIPTVGGEPHLERAGLTVEGTSLAIDRHRDRDVAGWQDHPSSRWRRSRHGRRDVLFVDLRRRRNRFELDRMLDAKNRRS